MTCKTSCVKLSSLLSSQPTHASTYTNECCLSGRKLRRTANEHCTRTWIETCLATKRRLLLPQAGPGRGRARGSGHPPPGHLQPATAKRRCRLYKQMCIHRAHAAGIRARAEASTPSRPVKRDHKRHQNCNRNTARVGAAPRNNHGPHSPSLWCGSGLRVPVLVRVRQGRRERPEAEERCLVVARHKVTPPQHHRIERVRYGGTRPQHAQCSRTTHECTATAKATQAGRATGGPQVVVEGVVVEGEGRGRWQVASAAALGMLAVAGGRA